MNLTVAKKIIGGFTIITLLLLGTSILSLMNLSTISESTKEVREVAIPMLQQSNELAINATQMGNILLKAYYQTDLTKLQGNKESFETANNSFLKEYKSLKATANRNASINSTLNEVDSIYEQFNQDVLGVFNNRKLSIETKSTLSETASSLEEKADDSATLMLDLADNKLAKTKLQRAISLGERLETLLNGLVSSGLEYRDNVNPQTTNLIESEMSRSLDDIAGTITDVVNELNNAGLGDTAEELSGALTNITGLINGSDGIVAQKATQLKALADATSTLASTETEISKINGLMKKIVDIADQTSTSKSAMVADAVSDGNTKTTVIFILSVIAAVAITYFTLISITRPLGKINDMLNVVASGDLSRKLDESGRDEFAVLAKNCNQVIENLRQLIQGIINRSTQLAAAAEQTSAVTAQSTTAIEEQRSQVEQAASATTEMSSTSQSMLSSVNDALGEIKQADEEAEHVKSISQQNKRTIEQLANEVESASQVINKLQQDSASIGGILDVIRGIAEQTNLLALNAAIEAARAGEQGRGFAVVADEVRTLASRTQESTQEIQNMIEVLQSGSEQAVKVMETGKSQATECVKQADIAAQALETITEAVHQAYDRSTQVASAADEQSQVAHEISANLESIVAIAEQTTAGSQQTAASSSEVARLAEELQQSVQEFKV